ncbi:MAG: phosphatase PAP2 family protein [Phycisphaera sp.]|nr:phosphatase PAP2 family protein [Phycisphaera sp.]
MNTKSSNLKTSPPPTPPLEREGGGDASCRSWRHHLFVLAGLLVAAAVCVPFDAKVIDWARGLDIGGDVGTELRFLQQFGQLSCVILVTLLIALQDPRNRKALVDFWVAYGLAALIAFIIKLVVGRARPQIADGGQFVWPWMSYVKPESVTMSVPAHPWMIFEKGAANLQSMPSSHTCAAAITAFFIATLYPRLTPIVIVLTVIVGMSRVLFVMHYPSDVCVGAAVGYLAGCVLIRPCTASCATGGLPASA